MPPKRVAKSAKADKLAETSAKKVKLNKAATLSHKVPIAVSSSSSSGGNISTSSSEQNASRDDFNLKVSSWNVNGVRAWIKKKEGADYGFFKREDPDIFVLQETKVAENKIPVEVRDCEGYHSYWSCATKDGYSGVALFSKVQPKSVVYGMGIAQHDSEGRLITAEYDNFYLVAAYVPNSGRGLPRLQYRRQWNADFLNFINGLNAEKPVIYCGDLNVAHHPIDLKNPQSNTLTAGFTKEEREDFSALLQAGYLDAFRVLYPDRVAYTFWSAMRNARQSNAGWRLDYFVLSQRLRANLSDVIIHSDVLGSDHCPLSLFMKL